MSYRDAIVSSMALPATSPRTPTVDYRHFVVASALSVLILTAPTSLPRSNSTLRALDSFSTPMQVTAAQVSGHNPRLADAKDRIEALTALEDNWNGHEAESPDQNAARLADAVVEALYSVGLIPDRIQASVEGGIAVAFIRGQKYADFECFNSGELLASTSDRQSAPRVWAIQQSEIPNAVSEIQRFLDA